MRRRKCVIGRCTVHRGDCIEVMASLRASSVHTILTDPPYGIRFMGKAWDGADIECRVQSARRDRRRGVHRPGATQSAACHAGEYDRSLTANRAFQAWCTEWASASLRVAKPGAMMLVHGGTRTFHRLTCALEDAGWEIRDCLMWLYGSGFPKSHNFKLNGWKGYGTALKPAWEPIILAMKPLDGTFAANAQKHGVAGLNVDGARIDLGGDRKIGGFGNGKVGYGGGNARGAKWITDEKGRWPANLILDEDAAAMLDEQSGERGGGFGISGGTPDGHGKYGRGLPRGDRRIVGFGDSGGASRFFYCAKASRAERNAGLGGMQRRSAHDFVAGGTNKGGIARDRENFHPTVKPLELMEYLCRLTRTPRGGVVLDPFMGSGTTGIACINTGRRFIGIEREGDYFKIACKRIKHAVGRKTKQLIAVWQ